MRNMHVNPPDALQIMLDLEAKQAMGVHWGTFRLTQEAFDQPPRDLALALRERGLPTDAVWLLRHGETRAIPLASGSAGRVAPYRVQAISFTGVRDPPARAERSRNSRARTRSWARCRTGVPGSAQSGRKAPTARASECRRPAPRPDLGDRKLDKLMVRDVQVWVNTLRVRCQCCFQGKDAARPEPQCCALGACCHEVASDWTVHQAWRVLRGALTQAMREELVFRNVAALVRVPMPRSKKMPVWTVDEARRFLESARADGDPMYAGYVLLLTLGLRRGEMLGLAWEDVDLEGGEALIAWQVQRVDHQLLRRHTKTPSSDAPLPLPEIAVRALERHRVEEARRRLAAGDMWGDCGLVFTTRLGDPVDPRNFHRDFKLRAAKAGVPVVPIHSTRRTCASLLVALDVHPRVAMAVLRHSRIALTMEIYSQVSSTSTRDALRRFGGEL